MRTKRLKIATILMFVVYAITAAFSSVSATHVEPGKIFALSAQYLDPEVGGSADGQRLAYYINLTDGPKVVYKIVQKSTLNGSTDRTLNQNIYCIKAGPGFHKGEMESVKDNDISNLKAVTPESAEDTAYNEYFDLKKKSSITDPFDNYLPSSDALYNGMLWILDNGFSRPVNLDNPDPNEEAELLEYRRIYLTNALVGKTGNLSGAINSYNDIKLTDNDIEFAQQLAIWHFTNYGTKYDLKYQIDNNVMPAFPAVYLKILSEPSGHPLTEEPVMDNPYFTNGKARQDQIELLYFYLIEMGESVSSGYNPHPNIGEQIVKPVYIDKTQQVTIKDGTNNNYIVGPYKIKKDSTVNFEYEFDEDDIQFTDINGNSINYTIVNENGQSASFSYNNNFYISIPKTTNISKITISLSGSYYQTTTEYWSVAQNVLETNQQPLGVIARRKVTFDDSFEATPELPQFDLALRKFIVSVTGNEGTITFDREPEVTVTPLLNGGTTATYVHSKDPVTVKTGETVLYTIRVYNEGSADGYAKEIVDYLPSGLKLKENSTINSSNGWSQEGTDGQYDGYTKITTSKLENELIGAFSQNMTEPNHKDVQVECEVIATPTSETQSFKNIAEIEDDLRFGTDLKDIDSDTDSIASGISSYPFDPNRGVQDDDDFEALEMDPQVVIPKFDLALRKFIVSVNDITVSPSRVPVVDSRPLRTPTARYTHPKDAVTVKTGDIVVYTIRVYNEGEVDGYATQIADYLPAGLALVPKAESEINTTYGWEMQGSEGEFNGYTKYISRYLENTKIDHFDKTVANSTPDYEDVLIECVVTAEPEQGTTTPLKNIAEINADLEDYPDGILEDRDSTPGNVYDQIPTYPFNPKVQTQHEDDDDFEALEVIPEEIIEVREFDLALRKFVTQVNDTVITNREPQIVLTPLTDDNENTTTAIYNHPKAPVAVSMDDEVIYTIRAYNEGQLDGYVTKITDYLPPQLEFVNDEFNTSYGWQVKAGSNGRVVETDITDPDTSNAANSALLYQSRRNGVLLKAFEGNGLDYIDVKIKCKVKNNIDFETKITNIAEITGAKDTEGNIVASKVAEVDTAGYIKDRDSFTNDITLPTDANLSSYKDLEIEQGLEYIPGYQDDDDFEKLQLRRFDLALRKFITAVNDEPVRGRAPIVTVSGGIVSYSHPKTPVEVINGDVVTYTLRVFNEGDQAGYASEIKDDLPYGLEFLPTHEINTQYKWKMYKEDGTETTDLSEAKYIKTSYLSKENETTEGENLIAAFDPNTMTTPDFRDVKVAFKVVASVDDEDRVFTNIAEIAEDTDEYGNPVDDIDSDPNNDNPDEDDIDIEKVKVKYFDLALRKFITAINDEPVTSRIPRVTVNDDGTFTYDHPKTPVNVINGDVVTYTLRVFNEGTQDGYASEIKDDLPEGLVFLPENEINVQYKWKMYKEDDTETEDVNEAKYIKTTYLSKEDGEADGRNNLISGFDPDTMTTPDFRDVKVAFRVSASGEEADKVYINIAEISDDSDEHGNPVDDVDSEPNNDEPDEDDIDIEQVKVRYFDLALRKFITGVNDEVITDRIPIFTVNEEDGTFTYVHPKDPVEVVNGDVVTYTIRVFNEGSQPGYASEIEDSIPEGLEFLPENEINVQYKWKMYKEDDTETEDVNEAKYIKTTYLSKEDGEAEGRDNLLLGFDTETMTMPDFRDVKVAFKVTEPDSDSDRIYINIAEISDDSDENGNPVDDVDSEPNNDVPDEDDIDQEEVKVKFFDLALKKWITTATTIINGQTTVIHTGHTGDENPEPPVKIEIKESEIDSIVVKFTYTIKVTNEGEIPGYATEIREYIPQGLRFVKADNPDWEEDEEGRVVTTKLADILLRPGESTMIDIVLTWINGSNNFGQKVNVAEISKDHNDSDTPDIDSTPDNQVPTEDDIDDAPVVLSVKTGVAPVYIVLTTAVLAIISAGIILIKKYVM